MSHLRHEIVFAFIGVVVAFCAPGCTSPLQTWQSLKGEGFPGWNEQIGSGIRASKNARPSGFFTDRKSEQIEQDLGGF